MAMVEIRFWIPEELARDASEFDLLQDDALLHLLQAELDRRVMEMVNREVHAQRAERRASQSQDQ